MKKAPSKSKYPARPEQFRMRVQRVENYARKGHLRIIPAVTSLECELILKAYYGGTWRMLIAIAKKDLWLWQNGLKAHFLYWISDRIGWTKITDVPETEDFIAHQRRHGRTCHASPNCEGGCIERDQPKWFRRIIDWSLGL